MNLRWKMPKAPRTGLVLAAVATCSVVSCVRPEAFNPSLAADGATTPRDGGADSKGSGSGGTLAGVGGTGGANVVGRGFRRQWGRGRSRRGSRGSADRWAPRLGRRVGGMSGGAGRPGGSDENATGSGGSDENGTGSGGSVGPESTGGMAGAAVGPGAAGASGSRGAAGGAPAGGARGDAGGDAGGGATGTGGSPPATGPCAALCTNPTAISLPHAAADLGSDATCEEAKGSIDGGNCGNFVSPRTFKVNGVTVPCTTADWTTIPPRRNGGYCFQASAGSHSYAYFVTF